MKGYKIILKFRFTHIQQDCVLNRAGQSTIPNSNICNVVLNISMIITSHIFHIYVGIIYRRFLKSIYLYELA